MTNRDLLTTDELELLRARARAVTEPAVFSDQTYSVTARHVAGQLGMVVRRVANAYGVNEMRAACAWLAGRAWPNMEMGCPRRDPIMAIAKALADSAGQVNVRDALAFWASETDPAVWQGVVAAAAA